MCSRWHRSRNKCRGYARQSVDNPPSGDGSHRRDQYSTSLRFERSDFLVFDGHESFEFAISIGRDSVFSVQQLVSRRRTGEGTLREGMLEGFSLGSYLLLVDYTSRLDSPGDTQLWNYAGESTQCVFSRAWRLGSRGRPAGGSA